MRSFQHAIVLLFSLFAFALAQSSDTISYDATVYLTSTVYRVNTITLSGTPTASVANVTSTIAAPVYSASSIVTGIPSASGNGTSPSNIHPTGSTPTPSSPAFTGAASTLNVNAFVAVVAAGIGYMAL